MRKFHSILIFCFCFFLVSNVTGQDTTAAVLKQKKPLKNTIRLNITNPVIFGNKSFVAGYERVLSNQMSFSVNLGRTELPNFGKLNFSDSTVQINKSVKNRGFHITGDFRYYPSSENKHAAPRGIYFGPYASFVTMGRENSWELDTDDFEGTVGTDLNFQFFSVGAQLGYQFVIWRRLALDFVLIGPGVAFYELSAKLDTDLSAEDESALFDRINEILEERFPAYNFAFDGEFKTSGSAKTTSIGYRYVVHLGFRF